MTISGLSALPGRQLRETGIGDLAIFAKAGSRICMHFERYGYLERDGPRMDLFVADLCPRSEHDVRHLWPRGPFLPNAQIQPLPFSTKTLISS